VSALHEGTDLRGGYGLRTAGGEMPFPADRAVLELLGTLEPDYLIDLIDVDAPRYGVAVVGPIQEVVIIPGAGEPYPLREVGRACEYKPVLIKGHKPWIPVNLIKCAFRPISCRVCRNNTELLPECWNRFYRP